MAKLIKVGEFRNRLSAYLRKVRQGGEVVISDRETPIGRLIPYRKRDQEEAFEMINPPGGYGALALIRIPKRQKRIQAVKELLKDRRKR